MFDYFIITLLVIAFIGFGFLAWFCWQLIWEAHEVRMDLYEARMDLLTLKHRVRRATTLEELKDHVDGKAD